MTMKRILVINVNWLGDILFSTPFLRTVRAAYPEAFIASLVLPRGSDVLRHNPRLNEVIEYDEQGRHGSLRGKARFLGYLRKQKFDTAFILHPSWKRALISVLAGIPNRIGYATKHRQHILSVAVPVPITPIHKIDYFLAIARACGMSTACSTYEFFISNEDHADARRLLQARGVQPNDAYVVFNPGGNWEPKRWPAGHFSRLGDMVSALPGIKVVVVGAPKDIGLAASIAAAMTKPAVIVAGQTSLGQLAAIMKASRAVISADSGPMHIAAAVGSTVIALFGPTEPALTGPRGSGKTVIIQKSGDCAVPCYRKDCVDHHCMSAIQPQDVWQSLAPFLTPRENSLAKKTPREIDNSKGRRYA